MAGDVDEREQAAERLDNLVEFFNQNHDPDGAAQTAMVEQAVRNTPELTGDEADGLVNDARAGNFDHADQVINDARNRTLTRPMAGMADMGPVGECKAQGRGKSSGPGIPLHRVDGPTRLPSAPGFKSPSLRAGYLIVHDLKECLTINAIRNSLHRSGDDVRQIWSIIMDRFNVFCKENGQFKARDSIAVEAHTREEAIMIVKGTRKERNFPSLMTITKHAIAIFTDEYLDRA